MAPEILQGHAQSTPAIDVWSMGIILYGLVIGEVPFRSKTREDLKAMIIKKDIIFDNSNERLHSHLSGELKDLLKRMLDKKPHTRISIPEIFEHPWMAKYKEQKMKRAFMGYYSDSEEVPENLHLQH